MRRGSWAFQPSRMSLSVLPSASCLPPNMRRCWSDFGIPSVSSIICLTLPMVSVGLTWGVIVLEIFLPVIWTVRVVVVCTPYAASERSIAAAAGAAYLALAARSDSSRSSGVRASAMRLISAVL